MTDPRSLSPLDLYTPDKTFLDANELVINMGPQHPATHGVLRVILRLDGEKVLGLECVIGYLHRGVEKIAENRTYTMFNPYVDRMDYVAAVSNGLGYCEAVEKLLSVEAPPRAQYIRVILTELNRIASHQLWLGTHALDIGAITPLFYTFRDREEILKIFEKYCGARLTTHAFRIGGLQYEAYDGFERDVKNFVSFVKPKIDEYEELLTTNRIWLERTKGVGVSRRSGDGAPPHERGITVSSWRVDPKDPHGTWSDEAHKSGYFTAKSELKEPLRYILSYALPHRGFYASAVGGDGSAGGEAGKRGRNCVGQSPREGLRDGLLGGKRPAEPRAGRQMEDLLRRDGDKRAGWNRDAETGRSGLDTMCAEPDDGIFQHLRCAWLR